MNVSTFSNPQRDGLPRQTPPAEGHAGMPRADTGARLEVLGVRGGFPAAAGCFLEYGGNTSCLALTYGDGVLCFDAGSGLPGLARRLGGVRRVDILISHVHIDHILGLYYLSAFRVPELHLYGEARPGAGFREQLEAVLRPPYWPLELCALPGVRFHEIAPGDRFTLPGGGGPDVRISTLRGNHPNGSLLYRADLAAGSVVYALDCEMDETMPARLADFARDCGVLVWDANFTRTDKRPGWGHSTWEEGLAAAGAAGAGRVLMTHYSGEYTDTFLREQERLAVSQNRACVFAREGMVMDL